MKISLDTRRLLVISALSLVGACDRTPEPVEMHTSVAHQGLCGVTENECDGLESYTDEEGDEMSPDCRTEMVEVVEVEGCADCDDDLPEDPCGGGGAAPTPAELRQACVDAANDKATKALDETERADVQCQSDANQAYNDCTAMHEDNPVGLAGCLTTYQAQQAACALDTLGKNTAIYLALADDLAHCKTGLRVTVVLKPVQTLWGWIKKIGDKKPDAGTDDDEDGEEGGGEEGGGGGGE